MKLELTSRSEIPEYLNSHGYDGVGVEVGVLRGEFSRTIQNIRFVQEAVATIAASRNINI